MPLPPGATPIAASGSWKARSRKLLSEKGEKRRGPDGAPAEIWRQPGRQLLAFLDAKQNHRTPPHAQPSESSRPPRDEYRTRKHFKAGGLTTVAPYGEQAPPHPAAGKTPD